jgi:hypothetical protein
MCNLLLKIAVMRYAMRQSGKTVIAVQRTAVNAHIAVTVIATTEKLAVRAPRIVVVVHFVVMQIAMQVKTATIAQLIVTMELA